MDLLQALLALSQVQAWKDDPNARLRALSTASWQENRERQDAERKYWREVGPKRTQAVIEARKQAWEAYNKEVANLQAIYKDRLNAIRYTQSAMSGAVKGKGGGSSSGNLTSAQKNSRMILKSYMTDWANKAVNGQIRETDLLKHDPSDTVNLSMVGGETLDHLAGAALRTVYAKAIQELNIDSSSNPQDAFKDIGQWMLTKTNDEPFLTGTITASDTSASGVSPTTPAPAAPGAIVGDIRSYDNQVNKLTEQYNAELEKLRKNYGFLGGNYGVSGYIPAEQHILDLQEKEDSPRSWEVGGWLSSDGGKTRKWVPTSEASPHTTRNLEQYNEEEHGEKDTPVGWVPKKTGLFQDMPSSWLK